MKDPLRSGIFFMILMAVTVFGWIALMELDQTSPKIPVKIEEAPMPRLLPGQDIDWKLFWERVNDKQWFTVAIVYSSLVDPKPGQSGLCNLYLVDGDRKVLIDDSNFFPYLQSKPGEITGIQVVFHKGFPWKPSNNARLVVEVGKFHDHDLTEIKLHSIEIDYRKKRN